MTEPAASERIAAYACEARDGRLPDDVVHEAWRCLVNFAGCALGGTTHDAVAAADAALSPYAGAGPCSVLGRGRRTDPLLAALLNGTAASAHSFDDTHAQAIVHAGAPVVAAALASAQATGASGSALLAAIALGAETTFRASKAISVAPAVGDIAWYQTGLTGGLGAALAAGMLLRLDPPQLARALGIAVAQASGTRVLQGSMTMLLLAGHAAQSGVRAALLARAGLESPRDALDGPHGFVAVHAKQGHAETLTAGLGSHFELRANTYKAYPCGVVLHPVVDACLALHARSDPARIREIVVRLHPAALALTDRPHPGTRTAAQVSVQHWAAVALLYGRAGLPEGDEDALRDPVLRAFREHVRAAAEEGFARDEAEVAVTLDDGSGFASPRHRGVAPMSDAALERKFREQAALVLPTGRVDALLDALRAVPSGDLAPLAALF